MSRRQNRSQPSRQTQNTRAQGPAASYRPQLESLENRDLMATLVVLDFDGMTAAEHRDALQLHSPNWAANAMSSFVGGFNTLNSDHMIYRFIGPEVVPSYGNYEKFQFLDFNNDGRLNSADGEIAASRIMDRVRRDFEPYDVLVVREDNTARALERIASNSAKDTLVRIDAHAEYLGGQAALDNQNQFDSFAKVESSLTAAHFAYDQEMAAGYSAPRAADRFLNLIATFISHEVGHTFGLEHLIEAKTPSLDGRTLMDPFMDSNDVGFTDMPYIVGYLYPKTTFERPVYQNEHQYLNEVVGPSKQEWAAVLRPGELTIQGSSGPDKFTIQSVAGSLAVNRLNGWGGTEASHPLGEGANGLLNGLNQFDRTIDTIRFDGGQGSDYFFVADSVGISVQALGGEGDDTLYGGRSHDLLQGGEGNDTLYGQGGVDWLYGNGGNDTLYGGDGNDWLWGGAGNDWLSGDRNDDRLYGESGADYLFGGANNDWLDGGFDFVTDHLFGNGGFDTLVQHIYSLPTGTSWYLFAEDVLNSDSLDTKRNEDHGRQWGVKVVL